MPLLDIAPTDLADIAVVGLLLWGLVTWTRRVHARMALIGLAFLGGFYLLARQFELQLTAWIFQGFFAVLVVLLLVVFQDDLRRLFEQIAALGLRRKASRPGGGSLAVLIRGMHQLAEKRRGALVVLPGRGAGGGDAPSTHLGREYACRLCAGGGQTNGSGGEGGRVAAGIAPGADGGFSVGDRRRSRQVGATDLCSFRRFRAPRDRFTGRRRQTAKSAVGRARRIGEWDENCFARRRWRGVSAVYAAAGRRVCG